MSQVRQNYCAKATASDTRVQAELLEARTTYLWQWAAALLLTWDNNKKNNNDDNNDDNDDDDDDNDTGNGNDIQAAAAAAATAAAAAAAAAASRRACNTDLMPAEDGQLVPWTLSLRNLILAVSVPFLG